MSPYHSILGILLLLFVDKAPCQLESMMERQMMRSMMSQMITETMIGIEVQRAVDFIIGHKAVPSQELKDFAMQLGREPSTEPEKDLYLHMMKGIARQTPELLKKFIRTRNINGTDISTLDEIALDAHVTRRALTYNAASAARRERRRKEQEQQRQHQEEVQRMRDMHQLNLYALIGRVGPQIQQSSYTNTVINDPFSSQNSFGGTGNLDTMNFMLLDGADMAAF